MYGHGITCHHAGLGAAAVPATLSVCVHEPEPQLERASPLIARSVMARASHGSDDHHKAVMTEHLTWLYIGVVLT